MLAYYYKTRTSKKGWWYRIMHQIIWFANLWAGLKWPIKTVWLKKIDFQFILYLGDVRKRICACVLLECKKWVKSNWAYITLTDFGYHLFKKISFFEHKCTVKAYNTWTLQCLQKTGHIIKIKELLELKNIILWGKERMELLSPEALIHLLLALWQQKNKGNIPLKEILRKHAELINDTCKL